MIAQLHSLHSILARRILPGDDDASDDMVLRHYEYNYEAVGIEDFNATHSARRA